MAKVEKIESIPVEKLIPYVNNAKKHPEEQVTKIAASIREFGFLAPVLIDKDYNIIAGHGRVLAAKKLGEPEVPCVYVEGLTEAQRKAYILADNKLGESDWDMEMVTAELEGLAAMDFDIDLTGFDFNIEDTTEVVEDDYDIDLPAVPTAKLGDIYQLGAHRLMCGDSTSTEDVQTLMGGTS